MKLQLKFVIYNAFSKAVIIAAFGFLLPMIVERVVYHHIDNRLEARKDLILKKISVGGLNQALLDENCSFNDFNIFKEEFISIQPLKLRFDSVPAPTVKNEVWNFEGTSQQEHRVIKQPFLFDNQWYELNIGEGISTIDKLKKTITVFSLWTMIIVIILSVFVDLGFVRIIMKPFNKIVSNKLRDLRDPFAFDFTKIKSSTYEFSYLDESINQLMKKIKDAITTEREFISNVSHELLTPVSILQNRLENIVADEKTPDEISLKIIESQKTLNRLSKIIKTLLMISKIENEQYVKNESVDIRLLVDEVIMEIEERLQQKNIQLKKLIYDDFTFSPCNKSLIHTLVFNLVNNAIKYNKENGTIIITGRIKGKNYLLEIADTGIGIEKNQISGIFGRFKKISYGDENSYGLGLPIVKTIAGFHRINIDVKSEVNTGTEFILSFPVS